MAHRLTSFQDRLLNTHTDRKHISHVHCTHPETGNDSKTSNENTDIDENEMGKKIGLLTPLLSRQVWLLLGHSQAFPSQPSEHTQRPIMQEPRSDSIKELKYADVLMSTKPKITCVNDCRTVTQEASESRTLGSIVLAVRPFELVRVVTHTGSTLQAIAAT